MSAYVLVQIMDTLEEHGTQTTFCQNIILLQWIFNDTKSMKYECFQSNGKHNSHITLKFKNEVYTLHKTDNAYLWSVLHTHTHTCTKYGLNRKLPVYSGTKKLSSVSTCQTWHKHMQFRYTTHQIRATGRKSLESCFFLKSYNE